MQAVIDFFPPPSPEIHSFFSPSSSSSTSSSSLSLDRYRPSAPIPFDNKEDEYNNNNNNSNTLSLPLLPLPHPTPKRSRSELDEDEVFTLFAVTLLFLFTRYLFLFLKWQTYERLSKNLKSGSLQIPKFTHTSALVKTLPFNANKSAFKLHSSKKINSSKSNIPRLHNIISHKKKVEDNKQRLRQVARLNMACNSLFEEMRTAVCSWGYLTLLSPSLCCMYF